MKKNQLKQLIKEVLAETEYETDFDRMMKRKFVEFKSAARKTPTYDEQYAWEQGFISGYGMARRGH
jgi:hypothetical protein